MAPEVYEEEPRYQMHIQTHGTVLPHTKLFPRPCWISPEGKVYHCGAYEHVWLAGRIMRTIHGDPAVEGGWDAAGMLEKLGYIKVWESGLVSSLLEDTITQAQIDVLDELSKFTDVFGTKVYKQLQERLAYLDDCQNPPIVIMPTALPPLGDWD